jgi:hypothetical protein
MPDRQPRSPQQCREEAERCRRMADGALSPETCAIMLRSAAQWQALADQDEAKPVVSTG